MCRPSVIQVIMHYSWNGRQFWRTVIVACVIVFVLWNYWLLRKPDENSTGSKTMNDLTNGLDIPTHLRRTDNKTEPVRVVRNRSKDMSEPIKGIPNHIADIITTMKPHVELNMSYPRYEDTEKGVVIYGTIQSKTKYAVFSSTVHNEASLTYLFDLPLATLAWKRIGFESIAILVVDTMEVMTNERVKFVLSTLFQLQAVVIVIHSHRNFAVMISQVSRLFVPYLVDLHCVDDTALWENTYLVTSDADLWPISRDIYLIPDNKTDIMCLNAYCCGDFEHNSKSYSMLPIGNIGMTIRTWRSVTRRRGFVPQSVNGLITYFSREFGTVATTSIQKGENIGWFMDQRMISILIADWSKKENRASRVKYIRRDVGRDRIDRSAWRPLSLDGKVDTHVLEATHEPDSWHRLESLLILMYDRPLFNWCSNYFRIFSSLV